MASEASSWRREQDDRLRRGLTLFSYIAMIIFTLFWAMDWIIYPEVAFEFLGLRVLCAGGYLPALLIIRRARQSWQLRLIGACLAWWVSLIICVMLTRTGYETSLYHVGLVLVVVAIGTVFPWSWKDTMATGAGMAAMLTGVALLDPEPNPIAAINNVGFLLGAVGIAMAANVRATQMARAEFEGRATLAEAYDKLRRLDELKTRFFANVSHELRTPLTLIMAPVETLLARSDGTGSQELRVIHNNASRLTQLIDELLDLSRLDAGGLRLNVGEVDLHSIVGSLCENAQPAAQSKGIELVFDDVGAVSDVFGDAHRLEIVVTNLVSNALKHTPDGGRIELAIAERDDGVEVRVADNGPGIPPEDLEHVFDRFYQSSSGAERRRTGGVGIGLALAKELAELHEGRLSADSVVGEGAVFCLWLPKGRDHFRPEVIERRKEFRPEASGRRLGETLRNSVDLGPNESAAVPAVPRSECGGRILVVEDNSELRAFIRQLLEHAYDVIEAEDGQAGLEAVRAERPDLVISDIMMPRLMGTELCRQIKSDDTLRSIPVILLTARVGSEATLEAYAHGADDFVAKPFHPQVLLARVRAQLRIRALGVQLVGQEKMASIGTLAAGVAHEVRNPINAIVGAADVLLGEAGVEPAVSKKMLDVIADGAHRINDIVSALDVHVRPADSGGTAPCDVRVGLDATFQLMGHRMIGVSVHRDYETERPALIPPGPANQVFLNLIDNALRSGANNVWARVSETDGRVVVRIGDDGPGVPEDIAPRIFDPFFTTREPGQGTGLGLHLSRAIVTEHGGKLEVARREGGGAEFVVDLPGFRDSIA